MIEMNEWKIVFFVKWLKFSDSVKVGELMSLISDRKNLNEYRIQMQPAIRYNHHFSILGEFAESRYYVFVKQIKVLT